MNDILPQLLELASKRFGERAASLAADADIYESLGFDSLQALDLLTDLEDHFDIEVPDYELTDVRTLGGIADVIGRRL